VLKHDGDWRRRWLGVCRVIGSRLGPGDLAADAPPGVPTETSYD